MVQTISVRREGDYSINWGDISASGKLDRHEHQAPDVIPYLKKVRDDLISREMYEVHLEVDDVRSFTHLLNMAGYLEDIGPFDFIPQTIFEAVMSHRPPIEADVSADDTPEDTAP